MFLQNTLRYAAAIQRDRRVLLRDSGLAGDVDAPVADALAPKGASAYHFGEPTIESHGGNPTHHVAPAEWFRVVLNTDERLPRVSELEDDVELQLKLLDVA